MYIKSFRVITMAFEITNVKAGIRNTTGPLSKLSTNQKGEFLGLKYPSDLGSSSRKHSVRFSINENSASQFRQGGKTQIDPLGASSDRGQQILSEQRTILNVYLQPSRTRLLGTIDLYMPDTVNESYQAGYQEDNVSDYKIPYFGQIASSAFNIGENSLPESSESGDLLNLKGGGFANKLKNLGIDVLAATRPFAGDLVPIDVLLQSQGVAINPQVQLLFKSVGLRTFQFEFMFSAKSKDESDNINNIIRTFKFYSAPEIGGVLSGDNNLFFKIPSTFNIDLLYSGSTNPYLHRIGECVLESIAVDYAPNGWAAFEGGAPVQTRMTLQFKEIDIVDKTRFAEQGL